MPIELVSESHFPTTENAGSGAGPDVTLGNPGSLRAGDFLFVFMAYRANSVTFSVSVDGGQTWTDRGQFQSTSGGVTGAIFTAPFNGTWSNPTFTVTSGTGAIEAWLVALRGVDVVNPMDVAVASANNASSTNWTLADYSTNTRGAWAFICAVSQDDNPWSIDNSFVAPDGTSNIFWRTTAGTDMSIVVARRHMATAGAVGATVITQTALGGDPGAKFKCAIRPAGALPILRARDLSMSRPDLFTVGSGW